MNNQRQQGGALIALAVVFGVLAMVVVVCATSYVTNYNYGNEAEKGILAAWENNENILAEHSLKVAEIAQVPAMYRDDLRSVFEGAIQARYGEEGSQAMFQWLREQNPNFDSTMYTKIQTVMEAGRAKFANAQTEFVDKKRAYETNLGYLWKGTWLRIAGYPKIDLNEYKIITSGHAQKAFETGVDEGVKIR